MELRRGIVGLALGMVISVAWAQNASMEVAAFPALSVADGRSTVTVTATLRTRDGKLVPDGTRVVFSIDRGTFREPVVETRGGVARAILQTANEPGFAKITVSAIAYQTTATIDYEYVKDRSLLSTANEYIELNSPTDLRYSMDERMMEATGSDRGAVLTFKDIEIRADHIQVAVPSYEVRAKNAVVKIGDFTVECGQLYYKLNQRIGFGTTNYKYRPKMITPNADGLAITEGEERETYGVAEIKAGEAREPSGPIYKTMFEFKDLGDSISLITAKRAVAYPRKEVQFSKADVYMGGARIMRLPLFKVSVFATTPVVTDQMLKINDNSVAIDYPYYLDLAPGRSSLLRLSLGRGGSRGLGNARGMYLDYEFAWNRGDEMQGEFVVQSLGREDWGIRSRQYWRFDERTDLNLQLDMPSHNSLYGNLNLSRQFDGWALNAQGSASRSLRGVSFRNQDFQVSMDKDPVKVGKLPINLTYGVSASTRSTNYTNFSSSQTNVGVRGVARLSPIMLDRQTSLSGSVTLGKTTGANTPAGLTTYASFTAAREMRGGGFALSYDYIDDGFSSRFLGHHQLSARANLVMGSFDLNLFGLRSLDVDRTSMQIDASYRFNRDWRLSYAYTFDRFLSESFFDYNLVLGYRIGFREFGFTYSNRTKRLGFQVLGTALQ